MPAFAQHRRLVKTSTPGIYKRGGRYVVIFRDPHGKQRKRSACTLAEARDLKAALIADVRRGEYRTLSKVMFGEYAAEWIASYTGRTSRGIRPETVADYRRRLGLDEDGEALGDGAVAYFGRMQLAAIEPRDLKTYAATLAARGIAANTIRLYLAPVRALLATAFEDGVIRSNPAAGLRIAQRVEQHDEAQAKALTEEELRSLLAEVPAEWRLFFEFLAHTGLRIGEAVALTWADVDFGKRRVHVRRRLYRGRLDAPKSRYGRRAIPLSETLSRALWRLRGAASDEAPVFTTGAGKMVDASNLMSRVLKPAAVEAGLGEWVHAKRGQRAETWVGFHTFRHTCATILFRHGFNAKQVQMWLGHHSPAFTLATYVHLLPDDLPDATFLDALTAGDRGNTGATRPTEDGRNDVASDAPEERMNPETPMLTEVAGNFS
jgi:integrase